jgi:hypothetical protein
VCRAGQRVSAVPALPTVSALQPVPNVSCHGVPIHSSNALSDNVRSRAGYLLPSGEDLRSLHRLSCHLHASLHDLSVAGPSRARDHLPSQLHDRVQTNGLCDLLPEPWHELPGSCIGICSEFSGWVVPISGYDLPRARHGWGDSG